MGGRDVGQESLFFQNTTHFKEKSFVIILNSLSFNDDLFGSVITSVIIQVMGRNAQTGRQMTGDVDICTIFGVSGLLLLS